MDNNNRKYIEQLKEKVSTHYDTLTQKVNSQATNTYNTLFKVTEDFKPIIDKISVIGDMFTDLRVLNGTAKNIQYLSDLDVVSVVGLSVNDQSFKLSTTQKILKEISVKDSSISSIESYKLFDINSKSTTLDNFLKASDDLRIQFLNDKFTFTLNLTYPKAEQINNIELQLGLLTEAYPVISSIKYVDNYNNIQDAIILNNSSRNFDLDENRVLDNIYSLDIQPIVTKQLMVEFTSRTSSNMSFKSIKTYFTKMGTSGYIIVGPIHTETPILKLAIDATESTPGVSYAVSTDKEYWLPLTLSSQMSVDGNKILAFNTINANSLKTNTDVYSLYVKIEITSEALEDLVNNNESIYREDGVVSDTKMSQVEDNKFSAYRLKNSDFIYGKYSYVDNLNASGISLENVETIESNGTFKILGLEDTKYSITQNNNPNSITGSFGVELKLKRQPTVNVLDASTYDISNAVLYDVYPKYFEETINTKHKKGIVFTLKEKEDIYKIVSKETKKSLNIDLTTPFTSNSINTIIQVPKEDIYIYDSLNNIVATVDKKSLLVIKETSNGVEEEYYFLNLVDILFLEPIVGDLKLNKLYPLIALSEGEYGLQDGQLDVNSSTIVKFKGCEILKTSVDIVKVINYTNNNYIKRVEEGFTYYEEQYEDHYDLQTTIKLKSASIEKGSVVIEEFYGDIKDYISEPLQLHRLLNVNTVEEPKYLKVDADNDNKLLKE